MFRTLKEEAIWTSEFETYDKALEPITTWIDDDNDDRSYASP